MSEQCRSQELRQVSEEDTYDKEGNAVTSHSRISQHFSKVDTKYNNIALGLILISILFNWIVIYMYTK